MGRALLGFRKIVPDVADGRFPVITSQVDYRMRCQIDPEPIGKPDLIVHYDDAVSFARRTFVLQRIANEIKQLGMENYVGMGMKSVREHM
jgi:hypothetical protein